MAISLQEDSTTNWFRHLLTSQKIRIDWRWWFLKLWSLVMKHSRRILWQRRRNITDLRLQCIFRLNFIMLEQMKVEEKFWEIFFRSNPKEEVLTPEPRGRTNLNIIIWMISILKDTAEIHWKMCRSDDEPIYQRWNYRSRRRINANVE